MDFYFSFPPSSTSGHLDKKKKLSVVDFIFVENNYLEFLNWTILSSTQKNKLIISFRFFIPSLLRLIITHFEEEKKSILKGKVHSCHIIQYVCISIY